MVRTEKIILTIQLILMLPIVYGLAPFFNGRRSGGSLGTPKETPNIVANRHKIVDMYVTQKLDNFNKSNTATWKNRYYQNNAFYQKGGPIFLMFSGESAASKSFMLAGAWINYANTFNAMLFELEHRYYGKSHPTDDISTENLKHLFSAQFLADAANFIRQMNKKHGFTKKQKWIVFGGSYSGALAIWMREKYPDLVAGAVGSSGPVYLEVDFKDYLVTTGNVLGKYSQDCANNIQSAFEKLDSLVNNEGSSGERHVDNLFPLCRPIFNGTADDKANLLTTLIGDYMDIVQYNQDNTVYADITIEKTCQIMNDASRGDPINRLVALNRVYLTEKKEHCVDFKYKKMIRELQQTGWQSSVAGGDRQWLYQDCNEFGYFQTTDASNQIFGNLVPLEFLLKQCKDVFGDTFDFKIVHKHVRAANSFYGGYNPTVSNVASVQGSCDPWHTLGITNNNTQGVEGIFIEGTAHVADMYDPSSDDLPTLTLARQKVVLFLNKILHHSPEAEILNEFVTSSIIAYPTHKHKHKHHGPGVLTSSSSSLSNSSAVVGNLSNDSSLLRSQPYTVSLSSSSNSNVSISSSRVIIPNNSSMSSTPIQKDYLFPRIFPYRYVSEVTSSQSFEITPTPKSGESNSTKLSNTSTNIAMNTSQQNSTSNGSNISSPTTQTDNANRPGAQSPIVQSSEISNNQQNPSVSSPNPSVVSSILEPTSNSVNNSTASQATATASAGNSDILSTGALTSTSTANSQATSVSTNNTGASPSVISAQNSTASSQATPVSTTNSVASTPVNSAASG